LVVDLNIEPNLIKFNYKIKDALYFPMVVVADQNGRKNVRNEEPAFLATAIKEGRTSRTRKQLKMQLGLNN